MKALQKMSVSTLVCFTALLANLTSQAQTNGDFSPLLLNPAFADNPTALQLVTNLLAKPRTNLIVPEVSRTNTSPAGTYWTLHSGAPLPFNPYPDLPVYSVGTNNQYLIDDSSVDYAALDAQMQADAEIAGLTNPPIGGYSFDTNGLYLQVPTNSLATPGYFTVNVMNTIIGQSYDILTRAELLDPTWATVLTTNAVANVTQVQVPRSSTNLFVRARESAGDYSFYVNMSPLNQYVEDGDSVTFGVDTGGNTNLTYQWTLNGNPIDGATNSTYTIDNVQDGDAGAYAVTISDGTNSLTTTAGQLTTDSASPFGYTTTGNYNLVPILDSRQDYTFKSGKTYYIAAQTTFYGKTTIEGGAVIKPDWYSGGGIQIIGTLDCKTEPYFPAILTSVDDDSVGEALGFSGQDGPPFTAANGIPYLDMTYAQSNSVSNLRICFADQGVTTPVASRKLIVWDSQFVECNYGIVNLVAGTGASDSLHNVLFAACGAAVGASSNSVAIDGEQVTADVSDFCAANATPSRIALTNSIYWGSTLTAASLSTINVFQNPNGTNFVAEGHGDYYLTANSSLHKAGTANISSRLQSEFQHKTTFAPVPLAVNTTITGNLTLSPQAQCYTNGAPDIGYYYDALDYSVANLTLEGGNITVLPDTAIAVRNEYIATNSTYTFEGFFVRENSTFTSHGTPTKPNVFTAEKMVQEFPETGFAEYKNSVSNWFGIVAFVSAYELSDDTNTLAPTYNFRFSKFYLPVGDYHFWSGYDEYEDHELSPDSSMYLTLQDCQIHGGRINLGNPDQSYYSPSQVYAAGELLWINNSFENVSINLDPTYNEYGYGVNCDMQLLAYNNLFKNGGWLRLEPVPATVGNWTFRDNLFDKVNFLQDASQPLNFDHNGYWPLQPREFLYAGSAGELATSTGGTDGGGEVTLSNAPPYQVGVFGDFYLPDNTSLYGAGSHLPADAGLYQYTTRLDQTKEGDETTGHMVNIGIHYVAADSYGQPKDTDGDGIPDYVEDANGNGVVDFNTIENVNETDWQNPMTDGVTNDAYNVAYDNIDLSGDGLVGRIKKALGMNPFDASNPLIATQIITGEEPDLATFEVPVSYNLVTNIGQLQLSVDGVTAQFQECDQATNGMCLLKWNTTFDSPGQHYITAHLTLNGNLSVGNDDEPDPTMLDGSGVLTGFYSTNVCQFNPVYTEYNTNSGAPLFAQLPEPDANYTIELQTTNGVHIATITGSTSSGQINEQWGLTNDDGSIYTNGGDIDVAFTISLLDPATATHHLTIHPQDAGYVQDGNFTIAYATDDGSLANTAIHDCIEYGVVDSLISPPESGGGGSDDPYPSSFNDYTWSGDLNGRPGYLSGTNDAASLMSNFADPATRDFHFDGHGNPQNIGNNQTGAADVTINVGDVEALLQNYGRGKAIKGLSRGRPFRLVFLNACETADDDAWHNAFGIYRRITSADLAKNSQNAQAFVGWVKSPRIPLTSDNWYDFANTYGVLYDAWMNGIPLDDCLDLASQEYPFGSGAGITLNWPLNTKFLIIYTDGEFPYFHKSDNTFHLKIYGYAGLERSGYDSNPRHDSSHYYNN